MSERRQIDDQLRSKFENLEFAPSEEVWSRVNATLNGKKRKRRVFLWLSVASMVLMVMSVIMWQAFVRQPEQKEVNQNTKITGTHPKQSTEPETTIISPPIGQEKVSPDADFPKRNKPIQTEEFELNHLANKQNVSNKRAFGRPAVEMIHMKSVGHGSLHFEYVEGFGSWKKGMDLLDFPELPLAGMPLDKDSDESSNEFQLFLGLSTNPNSLLQSWSALATRSSFVNRRFMEILDQSAQSDGMINYGIQLEAQLKSGLAFQTGVSINRFNESYSYNYEISEFPVVDDRAGIVAYLPLAPQDRVKINEQTTNHWSLIQMPLLVSYHLPLGNTSFALTPEAGMNAGLLIGTNGILPNETNLGLEDLTDKVQDGFHLAAQLGLSLNYMPSERLRIATGPNYVRNLTNMASENSALELRPEMLGWKLGLSWRIKQ